MFRKLWSYFRSPHLTKASNSSARDHLLAAPVDSPEALDRLWSHFSESGDAAAVRRIVSVLDGEDVVRERLQTWLAKTPNVNWEEAPYREYRQLLIRCSFPIDYEKRSITGPVDLDLLVALWARNGELKFDELPVQLSSEDVVHLAMKSAALWSLQSFAQQNQVVARLCNEESLKPGGAARPLLANSLSVTSG
jgi:hypothetical protein